MNKAKAAAAQLRNLHMLVIGASIALIACMVGAVLMVEGPGGLVSGFGGSILFGLGFWLAAGFIAGLVLGKMDSVVLIGNSEGRVSFSSALDNLIVSLSCTTLSGRLVQNQIANLWSGVIGLAMVYAICQLLCAITGIATLGNFPGSLLAVVPFTITWKMVEGRTRDAIVRRHMAARS